MIMLVLVANILYLLQWSIKTPNHIRTFNKIEENNSSASSQKRFSYIFLCHLGIIHYLCLRKP